MTHAPENDAARAWRDGFLRAADLLGCGFDSDYVDGLNPHTESGARPLSDPDDCPAHSQDFMHRAVRQNRKSLGYDPQDCTCGLSPCVIPPARGDQS